MKLLLISCMSIGILAAACGEPTNHDDRRDADSVYTTDPVVPVDSLNQRDTSSYDNQTNRPNQP
jgi:hypothetical protein